MAIFKCKVITEQGQVVKIKIKEKDKMSCLKRLKKNGMTPISVETSIFNGYTFNKKLTANIKAKKNKKFSIKKDILDKDVTNKVSLKEIKEFTSDFYILRKSNFTDKHALITLINKTENEYFKKVLEDILKGIENGKYIYKTMKEYKNVFPIIYINLIKTGEFTNSVNTS